MATVIVMRVDSAHSGGCSRLPHHGHDVAHFHLDHPPGELQLQIDVAVKDGLPDGHGFVMDEPEFHPYRGIRRAKTAHIRLPPALGMPEYLLTPKDRRDILEFQTRNARARKIIRKAKADAPAAPKPATSTGSAGVQTPGKQGNGKPTTTAIAASQHAWSSYRQTTGTPQKSLIVVSKV